MPSDPPQILAYAATPSRPSGWQILLRTFLFLLGSAGGLFGMLLFGLWIWGVSGYDFKHRPANQPIWPSMLFFAILIAAFTSCVLVFRRFRKGVKWLLMGLFIAAGFASLAEGFCFLNQ
jgi:hypothetical protein